MTIDELKGLKLKKVYHVTGKNDNMYKLVKFDADGVVYKSYTHIENRASRDVIFIFEHCDNHRFLGLLYHGGIAINFDNVKQVLTDLEIEL